jgi:hypothetical protein
MSSSGRVIVTKRWFLFATASFAFAFGGLGGLALAILQMMPDSFWECYRIFRTQRGIFSSLWRAFDCVYL